MLKASSCLRSLMSQRQRELQNWNFFISFRRELRIFVFDGSKEYSINWKIKLIRFEMNFYAKYWSQLETKYHFTRFCVAILIPTENICLSRCKRWLKTSEMHEANYSDKRSFKLCFLHNFTALISVIAVFVLWCRGRRSRPKIVNSLISIRRQLSNVLKAKHLKCWYVNDQSDCRGFWRGVINIIYIKYVYRWEPHS